MSKGSKQPPKGPMKRLIVCCDGSWQSANHGTRSVPSNIAKISRAIACFGTNEKGDVIPQVVFYDAGVGTTTDSEEGHESWGEWFNKTWGGAFGEGLSENVCEAYNFLANNYCPGDEVYVFGFSRGAYTARAVAGLVGQVGLCTSSMMEDFWAMYRAYRHREPKQLVIETRWGQQEGRRWLNGCTYPVNIQAVGVFDTVGSLGWPSTTIHDHSEANKMHAFHDVNVHPNIRHAFQALAIDERRAPFSPTLWTLPKENTSTTLIQCWFPGVHINIGGGSKNSLDTDLTEVEKDAQWKAHEKYQQTDPQPESNDFESWRPSENAPRITPGKTKKLEHDEGDMETMANITFAWMVDLVEKSTQLTFDPLFLDNLVQKQGQNLSNISGMQDLGNDTTAHIAYRGRGAGAINDAFTGVKRLAFPLMGENRRPGQYFDVGTTHEYIHPIVHFSLSHPGTGYQPAALEGFERKPIPDAATFARFHPYKKAPSTGNGRYGYYWEKRAPEGSASKVAKYLWPSHDEDAEKIVTQIPEFQILHDNDDFESMERRLILVKHTVLGGLVDRSSKHGEEEEVFKSVAEQLEADVDAAEKFLKQLDVDNGY